MTNHKTINVDLGDRSYPIHIGPGLLQGLPELVPMDLAGRSVFIVTDKNVFDPHAKAVQAALEAVAGSVHMQVMEPGEQTKSYEDLQTVLHTMLEQGLERKSVVFAVGGGVIGDLAGFAASIALRGVPFVQVPTTLLSQVDSSVGGKTGINTPHGKNLVGSFYQPEAVICDTDTLKTLPKRELLAGYAESVKYGAALYMDFFAWFENNGAQALNLDADALSYIIEASCQAKARIVAEDEKEAGKRGLLNLGHTFGHALEAAAGYDGSLLHGEAVGIGMVLAFALSAKMGLCSDGDAARMKAHMEGCGLPSRIADIDGLQTSADGLIDLMKTDKKVSGGKLTFVLVKGIGEGFLTQDVDPNDVKAILEESMG